MFRPLDHHSEAGLKIRSCHHHSALPLGPWFRIPVSKSPQKKHDGNNGFTVIRGYTMVIPWLYHGYTRLLVIPWLYQYTLSDGNGGWSFTLRSFTPRLMAVGVTLHMASIWWRGERRQGRMVMVVVTSWFFDDFLTMLCHKKMLVPH